MAGPIPLTRWSSASSEPKKPRASRSATIRVASAGPIRGRASSSFAVARSTSIGNDGAGGAPPEPRPLEPPRRPRSLPCGVVALAIESAARFCRASAVAAAGAGRRPPRAARTNRTTPPPSITAERKTRAVRSALVGMRHSTGVASLHHHQFGETVIEIMRGSQDERYW